MQMYTCVTSQSNRGIYSYYYTLGPQVAAILADSRTVTPTNITSIATVMVRSFASASVPNAVTAAPTSSTVSKSGSSAMSTTSTAASPSSALSSTARSNTASLALAILFGAVIVIALLAFGAWRWFRHRNAKRSAPGPSSTGESNEFGLNKAVVDSNNHTLSLP